MPLHDNRQGAGGDTISMLDAHPVRSLLPVVIACSLRYNTTSSKWEYNYHDLGGWVELADQTMFEPPFRVRRVSIRDENNKSMRIVYDTAGNGELRNNVTYQMGIDAILVANVLHDIHITRLYLDQGSEGNLASFIILHG
jgi:hypothetical protein